MFTAARTVLLPLLGLLTTLLLLAACDADRQPGTGTGDADGGGGPGAAGTPSFRVEVVQSFPHDPQAFTQGLEFRDGILYESTGLEGQSSLRRVELESGRVLQKHAVPAPHFAEGLTLLGGRLYQLTWKSGRGFVYDPATLALQDSFSYAGEGWGLASDGQHLILSDGSATLRFLDPATFREVRRVEVRDGGLPLRDLNELEYIDGELWANVWQTEWLVRIDPATGAVRAWVDLRGLQLPAERTGQEDVLNGIAWDAAGKRLLVTGKLWSRVYQVRLLPG